MPIEVLSVIKLISLVPVARSIATKIKAGVTPQYKECARDLHTICQMILTANQNLVGWILRFSEFDFQSPGARSRFLNLNRQYQSMLAGNQVGNLRASCHEIAAIYNKNLSSNLLSLFDNNAAKSAEAARLFMDIATGDGALIRTVDSTLEEIDNFIKIVKPLVDADDIKSAEVERQTFNHTCEQAVQEMQSLGKQISDLAREFSRLTRAPVIT